MNVQQALPEDVLNSVRDRQRIELLLVLLVILLLVFSLYSTLKIRGLEGRVTSLQNGNNNQEQQLIALESEVAALNSEVRSLLYPTSSSAIFEITGACVSITPGCGGYVYLITLQNNGTTTIPDGYSVFLSFKDETRLTFFGFNTTLPQALPARSAIILSAASWPPDTNVTSKLSPGDKISVGIGIGNAEASIQTNVQN